MVQDGQPGASVIKRGMPGVVCTLRVFCRSNFQRHCGAFENTTMAVCCWLFCGHRQQTETLCCGRSLAGVINWSARRFTGSARAATMMAQLHQTGRQRHPHGFKAGGPADHLIVRACHTVDTRPLAHSMQAASQLPHLAHPPRRVPRCRAPDPALGRATRQTHARAHNAPSRGC